MLRPRLGRRAGPQDPGGTRAVLRTECPAAAGRELLFLPRDKKQKGGLRLDSLEAILKGGDSGPAVVPGKPAESLLVEAINFDGLEMPPSAKLVPEKIDILTRWVSLGAPWPARDRTAAHAASRPLVQGHTDRC